MAIRKDNCKYKAFVDGVKHKTFHVETFEHHMCRRTLENAKSTDFSADSLPDFGHRLVDYHHDPRSSADGLGCARDLRDHLPDCAYLAANWILGIPGVWAWRSQVSNPEQQLRIDLATFFAWASMSC